MRSAQQKPVCDQFNMKTADFDYHLPPESIAQTPVEPRDASRLLVLKTDTGKLEHAIFRRNIAPAA
jgi:S-adenosylmethionine:tRNA-ribosyltransferase-isomerase (queuine synthetase)